MSIRLRLWLGCAVLSVTAMGTAALYLLRRLSDWRRQLHEARLAWK